MGYLDSAITSSVLAGPHTDIMNPDELETQMYLVPGHIPSVAPPSCLASVLTALVVAPPSLEPSLQYKRFFKPLVLQHKQSLQPQQKPEAAGLAVACLCFQHCPQCSRYVGTAWPLTGDIEAACEPPEGTHVCGGVCCMHW